MEEVVILDYCTGTVHFCTISNDTDIEEYMESLGLDINQCSWMNCEYLNIERHYKK